MINVKSVEQKANDNKNSAALIAGVELGLADTQSVTFVRPILPVSPSSL